MIRRSSARPLDRRSPHAEQVGLFELRAALCDAGTAPSSGLLDVGRYPRGVDDLCVQLAATLEAATFGSIPRDRIMSWKYRKLLMNLNNAVEAVSAGGPPGDASPRWSRPRARRCSPRPGSR